MGKRKYDTNPEGSSKKSKKEENAENINVEADQTQDEINRKNEKNTQSNDLKFDVKHFRKELAAKQGQTMVLTQFLQVCLNPDSKIDYLLEYLKAGGNSHEILRQITADNKKNLSLATPAFHIFHLIILKVQSSLPHMISVTEEACRYFLNTFMSTVEIMISENSGPRHRKIVLKLLTSMVTLNPDLGVEVLSQAPLSPKHLQYITEKANYKEKDNVRTAFVHFMTSFLVDGHLPLIKALLEKQGLLSLVIPGLVNDDAESVLMFLSILKKNIIDNSFISKSLKLKTFSHQVLHNMFKIFSWKGPTEGSESGNDARIDIMNLLSEILVTLFTSHKLGLYFMDTSLGTIDVNKNQNLYKAILTLKRPWENKYECETILQIVYKCPDLHRAIINVVEQSFDPQHSPLWERTTSFVVKLLDRLKPEDMMIRMKSLSSQQAANFIRFMTLPVPLLKFIQNNLGKDKTISLYCIKLLVKMLQTLRRYMQILELDDCQTQIVELRNRLDYFVPKHLPTPSMVVSLIQEIVSGGKKPDNSNDYRLPELNDTDSLILLLDLLLLYNDIHLSFFETLEGTLDMKKLLDYSTTMSDDRISLLKFKIVSLWLTLDNTAVSLENSMFKELFLIMLDVYSSDDDNTWVEAKDTLHKFFRNTAIFEADEDEIHSILYTLRNSSVQPTSLIGDIIEYVLENKKELTEYVRNQIVHFEISDSNCQATLDKLFDDLMENRNTEDSVFLETKVPSPFIVGCMQFMRNNKETKKSLKHFLSLYVANLLHCNYSPELTEVLIGDSKLDIRNYIAGWTSQPISLPEATTEKDDVLKNISKSLINNEDISLKDIFVCLEESSEEDRDFVLNGVAFKVNVSNRMDSSELLIWAKYLIFCVIRLTNMGQMTEERQKKIADYFECIIAIGRKHHKFDICRSIIMSVFKNPHFLKIYKLLDTGKENSNILATTFLLQIMKKHEDIVNYLNRKHKILKSYQQKNYNEIVKAFVKIKKRKNVNTDHTVKVLEVIGLSKEDDLRVFNQIFSAEADTFVKEDKEPSIVLELLRVLIKKYSKSISLELPQGTLRKIMKLYIELLINKEVTQNLTDIEISLVEYFENKPHHCIIVTEDIFKKFFEAKTVKKTTALLANVLFKKNMRLCSVFKEQLAKPEVLSRRELTLPLGDAALNHKQFLLENKELLLKIYNECKPNILKLIEKPHKAGQTYVSSWKFIRKLILECMEVEECEKIFTKSYKFEAVESSHLHLFQAIFLKICLKDEVIKQEHLTNYFSSVLHLITTALKENKDINTAKDIVTNIYCVAEVCKLKKVDGTSLKITESSTWQNFCKAVLKDSLKVKTAEQIKTCGPQLLFLLTKLVKLFYPSDHEDIVTLFEMVTSHSEFLNVMLSYHSVEVKSRLVEFIHALITKNGSVMKTQQIPVYLSAYHATRSPCDRVLLKILHYYETHGLPLNEYKPYLFGDTAANHYAVRKNKTASLWAHPSPNQVMNLFEKDIIERTIRNFPVTQDLNYDYELPPNIDVTNDGIPFSGNVKTVLSKMSKDGLLKSIVIKDVEGAINNLIAKCKYDHVLGDLRHVDLVNVTHTEEDEGIYDPLFLFPVLSHILSPGSTARCSRVLRSGLLSVAVRALAARHIAAPAHVLHAFTQLLETETKNKNDKLFLTDFINTLRNSMAATLVQNGDNGTNIPPLPSVVAMYLARALLVSTAPFDPLYKPVNNFFIAKTTVDLTVVPDFLSLFHDSEVEAAERRLWILDVIKDGTKTMTDINVIFKTMCLKMIMDYTSSVLSDRKAKQKVVDVLASIVAVPRACEILTEGYGVLSWLHSVVRQLGKDDKVVVKTVSKLLKNMIASMSVNAFSRNLNSVPKNGKPVEFSELKLNREIEHEILIILYDLLQHVDGMEREDVVTYLSIFNLISKRTVKVLNKKQVLHIVAKTGASINDSEGVKILTKSLVKNENNILRSKCLQVDNDLLRQLSCLVNNYLV